jgi:hypothetical protein
LISAFIVLNVAAQVAQNVPLGRVPVLAQVGAALEQYAFWMGTNAYWRMFSPVHKMDWYWRTVATDPSGVEREIATPASVGSRDPVSLLTEFREAKLLLNLWTRVPMQAAYLDHRCRAERAAGYKPASIRLELFSRPIRSPAEAATLGDHRGEKWSAEVVAVWNCPR